MLVYIIGSLANPLVEEVADTLRKEGIDAFDQWRCAKGDYWADYAIRRGMKFKDAIKMDFVETAFQFDLKYLNKASIGVLVMPAGRSGGLELGYLLGQGKKGYVLYDGEPERPDLMAKLATGVCFSVKELINEIKTPAPKLYKEYPSVDRLHPITDKSTLSSLDTLFERVDRNMGGNRT